VPDGTTVQVDMPDEEPELSPEKWLELFHQLQRQLALTPEKAAEWKRRIADGRR
jgi:hypothetical protein